MASGQLMPKKVLIDQIRRTMVDGESGVYTVLTDKRRSIMLRFSMGKLVYSLCRSRNVADAINAIDESRELKFSYSVAQQKDQPELMAAAEFLQAIAPNESVIGVAEPVAVEEPRIVVEKFAGTEPVVTQSVDPALLSPYCEVARDYIGMTANVLVPDVFAKKLSTSATIEEIAAAIPIPEDAEAFRTRVMNLGSESADEAAKEVQAEPDHRLFF